MSYNLTPKTCPYCKRHYEPGWDIYEGSNKDTAWTFVPMRLMWAQFGKQEIIHVCRYWTGTHYESECIPKAVADGYTEAPHLIPKR